MSLIHQKTTKSVFLLLIPLMLLSAKAEAGFSTLDCSNASQISTLGIPQTECEVLEAFWSDTNGDGWMDNTNWDTLSSTANSWYGVTVSAGHVSKLSLGINNLVGTIPNFEALTALQEISLKLNELSGHIPNLHSLSQLKTLKLYGNRLSGSIPDLSNLSNLETAYFNSNQLTGSFPNVTGLSQLKNLWVYQNQLTGSIPDISSLSSLKQLFISLNQFTGLVPDVSGLTDMREFFFSRNQFSGTIPDMTGLPNLGGLTFKDNNFTFADFEAQHDFYKANISSYYYSPQAVVDLDREITVIAGESLTLTSLISTSSQNDSFQWYKNGIAITGETEQTYAKIATLADAGEYTYQVTNSVIDGLTLESHHHGDAITLIVTAPFTLDIDGDEHVRALTDGLLILRSLFSFSGDALINGAVSSDATRTSATSIQAYIQTGKDSGALDIDGNGEITALTDGLLILRKLFSFSSLALTNGAIGSNPTRKTPAEIEAYFQTIMP